MRKVFFVIQQWAIRSLYTNRLGLGLFKAMSAVNAKRRAIGRLISQAFSRDSCAEQDGDNAELRPFLRFQREFAKRPGWFLTEAQRLWDCLLCFQDKNSIRGNMLEIGVWKGKSAALTTLHAHQDETCVYVDRMLLAEFKDTISSIRKSNNLFLETSSAALPDLPEVMQLGKTFRWIHIDGEHSGEAVRRDLAVAHGLLAEWGIICVDDFPSCAYPQIIFAVMEYLGQHPSLMMFLCGHNKAYICRRESADAYLSFIKDDLQRELSDRGANVTIWKTGRPSDANCFGITNRVKMFDYHGPDWNPRQIEI